MRTCAAKRGHRHHERRRATLCVSHSRQALEAGSSSRTRTLRSNRSSPWSEFGGAPRPRRTTCRARGCSAAGKRRTAKLARL
eukprot:5874231-Prymnesium_polylepis.1